MVADHTSRTATKRATRALYGRAGAATNTGSAIIGAKSNAECLSPEASQERIERTVAARIAREALLTSETPLQLSVILDEAALRRPLGGADIMRAQLRHLVDRASLPNVELRVIPFAAYAEHAWACLPGPFHILHSPHDPPLALVITRGGDLYFEDVEPFSLAFRRLTKAALTPRRSLAMIAAVRREMT